MTLEGDHGNLVSLLERRLQANEAALEHSEQQVELLSSQLQDAKSQIVCLGDEADKEVYSLLHEFEQQEAELASLRQCATNVVTLSERSRAHKELEEHIADVRAEVSSLRRAEEASWERHAQVQENVETELAEIGALTERSNRRRENIEQAAHRHLEAANVAEHVASMATAAIANAEAANVGAVSAAEAVREKCEHEARQAFADQAQAEALAEAAELKCMSHADEIRSCIINREEAQEDETRLLTEYEAIRSMSERYEAEQHTQLSEISALNNQFKVAEEALADARGRLTSADHTFECELEVSMERRTRNLQAAHVEEVNAEAAACRSAAEREQNLLARIAARGRAEVDVGTVEARWLRLFRGLYLPLAEEQFYNCQAAWANGSRVRASRGPKLLTQVSLDVVQEVERQMEQGERRLQALERMHIAQVEAASKGARTAAAEIREAQAAWQTQIRDLRRELHQTEASSRVAIDANSAARAAKSRVPAGALRVQARLREEAAEVKTIRDELNQAEEAIGILVAGGDGGSGGLAGNASLHV